MARVTIKCFSVIRDVVGANAVEIEVGHPATVKGALDTLLTTYGEPLKRVLVDPATSEMAPFLVVLNGEAVSSTLDANRAVNSGDELTLIFPIGGGRS